MILGMDAFTFVHVALSLIGIVTGLAVLYGMLQGRRLGKWTAIFLSSTILTSATGFGFPFADLLPSHYVGIISLIVLVVAVLARYAFHLVGSWRWIYVATALTALYLNVFVLAVQLFLKVPALNNLAPNQTEPPFAIAQGAVAVIFLVLGVFSVNRFRGPPGAQA